MSIPRRDSTVQILLILKAARRRYGTPRYGRPPLNNPTCCNGLFDVGEMDELARSGYWPLPPSAIDYIAGRPTRRQQIAAVVRDVLAAELPEVLDYLEGRVS
jgi:hypothetical protein